MLAIPAQIGDGVSVAPLLQPRDPQLSPVFTSRARKRLSSVEAMNTSPLAVAIGPARAGRPVFCLSVESCSVIPSGICQAMSPVDVLIAVRRPHGGFWHGQFVSPILTSNVLRPGVVLS